MRVLTGAALLALLATPGLAQTGTLPAGLRCEGLLPLRAAAPVGNTVATGAPALGVGSNPVEPRRDPVDTRLEPNTGQAGVGVGTGVATTGAVGAAGVQALTRPTSVSEIKDKDVYTLGGEELGEVERVILGKGDQVFAVLQFGGFLGFGEQERIVPLRAMLLREDRIVMPCVTEAALKDLPEWREGDAEYRELEATYMAPFGLYP